MQTTKVAWTSRLTGLPWPWSRPAFLIMIGAGIAVLAVFISSWSTTHTLVVGLLVATVWLGLGLMDALRVIHESLQRLEDR
jgi:hypothetical protein